MAVNGTARYVIALIFKEKNQHIILRLTTAARIGDHRTGTRIHDEARITFIRTRDSLRRMGRSIEKGRLRVGERAKGGSPKGPLRRGWACKGR